MKVSASTVIAHHRENGETQTLLQHLLNVSALTREFAEKIEIGPAGELIGLLHDLGKYSTNFQNYLRSAVGLLEQDQDDSYIDPRKAKGKIDHSTAGAQTIWRQLQKREGAVERIVGEIFSICVASHHSGLIDCLDADGTDLLSKRVGKSDSLSHHDEASTRAEQEILEGCEHLFHSVELISTVRKLIAEICRRKESETVIHFKVGLLVRYLFSCLIDADRIDTADFEHPVSAKRRLHGRYEGWPVLQERLEKKLAGFSCAGHVDELRRQVSDHCLRAAERSRGIFSLTVPTGGGKTLASLRFALSHAARHRMDRIIFVIPFTSIIDQNAEEVRKILEDERDGATPGSIVLEHQSNLIPERQTWRNKILSENWDAPVVFTTSVQLLETLFGAGTQGARRMHQLANSVIVFDEIQTLPVRCVHLFNNAMNFLVESCHSSVLLCTATQPLLGRVDECKGVLRLSPGSEIVPEVESLFRELSRVEVLDERKPGGWKNEQVTELAAQELHESGSCLVVVNTKKAASSIYRLSKASAPDVPIFHLSTNMCPSHRKASLSRIRERLGSGEQLLCVSTQLIEAGVDVDFGSVIRFTAGLDSIAQAAGRCNRHGKRSKGRVHVVNPAEDPAEMLPDIRIGKDIAERVLGELARFSNSGKRDVLSPEAMKLYFHYYFFERRKEMSYPVKAGRNGITRDDSLLNMLSENTMAVASAGLVPVNYLRQSFMSAAEAFQAIDAPTQGVIVPFEDGKNVISDLCAAFELEKQFELLKSAQQFTVNVFPHVLQRLQKANAVHEVQAGTGILYLDSRYYDKEFGLSEYPVNLMEMHDV